MSTDATGGGQPGADGAVEPEVAAEGTEPTATTLAAPTAWDTATPSAWGTSEAAATGDAEQAALVPDPAVALDETAGEASDDAVADEAPARTEPAQADKVPGDAAVESQAQAADAAAAVPDEADQGADEPDKGAEPDEPNAVDDSDEAAEAEYDEDYDDYADDEAAAEYGAYEPEGAAPPQRSRRWPRVLLALGFVVLAAVIVGGAFAIVGSITHGFKKPVKVTYKKSALFSLKTGECFNPQGQSYSLISCDSPHQAEVFATFTLSGTKYPGATAIATQASGGCTTRLTGYVNPQLALSLTSTYVYPDSVAWQAGTRTVICEVRASNGTLTGSVRSASAS